MKGAEAAFGAALEATEEVHVGAPERALYCHQLALLRRDQGRVDEALGLLARAAEIHRGLGELAELGEVLAEKGRTLVDEDPRAALGPLQLAGELIPAATRPWPAAAADFSRSNSAIPSMSAASSALHSNMLSILNRATDIADLTGGRAGGAAKADRSRRRDHGEGHPRGVMRPCWRSCSETAERRETIVRCGWDCTRWELGPAPIGR